MRLEKTATLALVLVLVGGLTATTMAQPILGVERNHFTVNGVPKFLLLISYFAARRPTGAATWAAHEAEIRSHFVGLRQAGFDGIRMFPDYARTPWNGTVCNEHEATPLMRYSGNTGWIDAAEGGELDRVLTIAKEEGLVVDLSFAMELMPGMEKLAYRQALRQLTQMMRDNGAGYRHVLFDLENEYSFSAGMQFWPNCGKQQFFASDLQAMVAELKAIDPLRIITASPANTPHSTAVATAYQAGMDVVSYHEFRDYSSSYPHYPEWPIQTETEVGLLRLQIEGTRPPAQWKPTYFQEPDRWLPGCSVYQCLLTASDFVEAARRAKDAGAAAWTFHTEGMFKYEGPNGLPKPVQLDPNVEVAFINRVNAEVLPHPWRPSALLGSFDTPAVVQVPAWSPVTFGGWIFDGAGGSGSGLSQVQIEVWQAGGLVTTVTATPVSRPDVAAYLNSIWGAPHGNQYTNSGFQATTAILPGTYDVHIRVTSTVTPTSVYAMYKQITVQW